MNKGLQNLDTDISESDNRNVFMFLRSLFYRDTVRQFSQGINIFEIRNIFDFRKERSCSRRDYQNVEIHIRQLCLTDLLKNDSLFVGVNLNRFLPQKDAHSVFFKLFGSSNHKFIYIRNNSLDIIGQTAGRIRNYLFFGIHFDNCIGVFSSEFCSSFRTSCTTANNNNSFCHNLKKGFYFCKSPPFLNFNRTPFFGFQFLKYPKSFFLSR